MEFDPASLTLDEMLQMDSHALHQMARISAGTLTRYRALLGRLLLAIGRTDAHLELGCSSAVHYGGGLFRFRVGGCHRSGPSRDFGSAPGGAPSLVSAHEFVASSGRPGERRRRRMRFRN